MKYLIKLTILIFIFSSAKAQNAQRFFPEEKLITTGIYYYPEHWNENQWERDIKKISEMGFEFVHIAEFAWFKMEPVEGKYDFSWLDKVSKSLRKISFKNCNVYSFGNYTIMDAYQLSRNFYYDRQLYSGREWYKGIRFYRKPKI